MNGRGLKTMESFGELGDEGSPVNTTSRISFTSLADQTLSGITFTTAIAVTVTTTSTTTSSHAPNWLLVGGDADDGGACKSIRDPIS